MLWFLMNDIRNRSIFACNKVLYFICKKPEHFCMLCINLCLQ